jgi:hypothetical protein
MMPRTEPTMMPSTATPKHSRELQALTTRYYRFERTVSYAVAVAVWGVFLGVYLTMNLLTAVVVGAGLILAVRVPVFRSSGTVRLQVDDNPNIVREQFTDICPPILALQWCRRGSADGIRGRLRVLVPVRIALSHDERRRTVRLRLRAN